jgi:flagellar basal-body rod protein FlgF
VDKFLYVAMTGAKETMRAQAVNNHNLANASTTGFRADLAAFQSRAVTGAGFPARVFVTNSTTGTDTSFGALQSTGRDLDVAVQGKGFIAVQAPDGSEAYTRAGDLRVEIPCSEAKTVCFARAADRRRSPMPIRVRYPECSNRATSILPTPW